MRSVGEEAALGEYKKEKLIEDFSVNAKLDNERRLIENEERKRGMQRRAIEE